MRRSLAVVLWVSAAIALAAFSYLYYDRAFPEFSPEFALKRSELPGHADQLAKDLGFEPDEFQRAVVFDDDNMAKYFLELTYGLPTLHEAVRKGLRIWYWSVRYFIPAQQIEFSIHLDTEGRLTGLRHTFAETEPLPQLSRDEALSKAHAFLTHFVSQHPLASLALTETSFERQPGHTVFSFTWERPDWQLDGASYHIHISVSGDRVSRYQEHLDTPEDWNREFRKRRSENAIYQTLAETAQFLLGLGILGMFIVMMRRHEVLWHGFPYLWLIPVGIVLIVAEFSDFSSVIYAYDTTDDYNSVLAREVLEITYRTLGELIILGIVAFVADAFWRKAFPHHVPIRALFNGTGLATREALRAVPLGFFFALLMLAYVTAYYVFGRSLGIWSPTSIEHAKVLTSYFPAIEALSVGVSAALFEELLFRVLAVVLVYRLSGSRWTAIVVSAAVWGFLHSNYPQMPGFARGIELTLEGIALGWIVVRYGILPTLLAHCLFNTWLGAIVAWQTGSTGHMVMALAVSLWPIVLWIKGWRDVRGMGRFRVPAELARGSPPLRDQLVAADAILPTTGVSLSTRHWVAIALTIAGAIALRVSLPETPLAELGNVQITRSQAEGIADAAFARETGLDPNDFHRYGTFRSYFPGVNWDYLLHYLDADSLGRLARDNLYESHWRVEYFQTEERNAYQVYVSPEGRFMLLRRSLAETAPGAQLEPTDAVAVARQHLMTLFRLAPEQVRFVSQQMKQRTARRDYDITFESTGWDVGESSLRWTIQLLGDDLNGYQRFLKIPEAFERRQAATGWRETLQDLLTYTTILLVSAGIMVINGLLIMRHYVPWRRSLRLALILPAIALVDQVNGLSEFFHGYETTKTLMNFVGTRIVEMGVDLIIAYASGLFLFAALLGLLGWLTGTDARDLLLGDNPPRRWRTWLEGIGLALVGLTFVWAVDYVMAYLTLYVSDEELLATWVPSLSGYSPAVHLIAAALDTALQTALMHGIVLLLIIVLWKEHRRLLIPLMILVLFNYNLSWQTWPEVGFGLFYQIIRLVLLLWLYTRVYRFNPFAYVFLFYYEALISDTMTMLDKAWPAYGPDIAFMLLALMAPVLIGLGGMYRTRQLKLA